MRLFYTLLVLSALCSQNAALGQGLNPETVSKKLLKQLEHAVPDEFLSVHLVMADQVDLVQLDAELSSQRATSDQRAVVVIEALKAKAVATQGSLLSELSASPDVLPGSVKSYWVANAIFAKLKREKIAELSRRPEVAWIGLNGKLEMESIEYCPAPPSVEPGGREIGLSVIGAPELWALGYTGYGQIAFTNDTGVDPNPPAIAYKYRGFYSTPNASFYYYDESTQGQQQNVEPFDCGLHGTHVNGTILGLERLMFDTIGVAFNAQWIGASILCGLGTEDNVAAFQWSLDPDGDSNTTEDIPDIINNSWYDPSLDTLDCFSVYVPVSLAMEAAGIAVVYSAGNAGPGPETITQPHNINLNLVNAFTVGALNGNAASLPIADFSSRGPSHCPASDSSLLIKPEVSAPGVNVRSCVPDGYGFLSGTSMASPHTSGAILLLKEAFPYLPGKEFKLALYYTAIDLGLPGEDNTYGMGVINVKAAYDYLIAQGHVPVSPHVSNDALLVDVQVGKIVCEEEISPIIVVENGGTEPLTSFTVDYSAGNSQLSYTWTGGPLAQSERVKLHLPTLSVGEGQHRIRVELGNPNGVADDRPLNNVFEKKVEVLAKERLEVNAEGSNAVCEGASVLLRAEYDGLGEASVRWYDEPIGGNLLNTGMLYTSAPLSQPDTVYAEASYLLPVGLGDKAGLPSDIQDIDDYGLIFDVNQPLRLKSVKVFAEQTGLRQIVLYNVNGDIVQQGIYNVNTVGEHTVLLNWDIPPGYGYTLVKTGGKPLHYTTSGVAYPFVLNDLLTIYGPNDGDDDSYYFFYDWKVEIKEVCERTAVPLAVTTQGGAPGVSFTLSTDSVDLANNVAIQFTNTSTDNISSFDWNFGDGTGSSLESPTHSYSSPGIYVVSLAVTSLSGCTAFALDTIEVTNNGVSGVSPDRLPEQVSVYPNPTSDELTVKFELGLAKMAGIQLTDLTGRVVLASDILASQNDQLQIDLSHLTPGLYFLAVQMDGRKSVWKVVKI